MASSIDSIRGEILKNGFWSQENPEIGELLDDITRIHFKASTPEGLRLCRTAAFKNKSVSDVIKSFFPQSTLGFYRVYGRTRLTHCVLNRTDDMRILMVLGLSSGSEGTVYLESYKHRCEATEAKNGLLAIPDENLSDESLKALDIVPQHIRMARGGLAIVDAREWWRIGRGKWALLGFMIPDEVPHWTPLRFSVNLKNIIDEMISGTMGMNVVYFED
ncbi:hypothetical protein B0T10DRAFT_140607 [Thelonectria olida]|uniref:Uncharacterized protein n=1 Tax=Thelonectria olida TaxID=1576542 RepID=A0A9P8VX57_9HYPO|nr:hypothetical protein B0T10DRAFT_140607 [Thelonectria olida]